MREVGKVKLQTVFLRLVVVLYLVALVGTCLYVPSYMNMPIGSIGSAEEN